MPKELIQQPFHLWKDSERMFQMPHTMQPLGMKNLRRRADEMISWIMSLVCSVCCQITLFLADMRCCSSINHPSCGSYLCKRSIAQSLYLGRGSIKSSSQYRACAAFQEKEYAQNPSMSRRHYKYCDLWRYYMADGTLPSQCSRRGNDTIWLLFNDS